MQSKKFGITEFVKYLKDNDLCLYDGVDRYHITDIDIDAVLEIAKNEAKTGVSLLPQYLKCMRINNYSSEWEIQEYIQILTGEAGLNPYFVYTKEQLQNNLAWAYDALHKVRNPNYKTSEQLKEQKERQEKKRLERENKTGFIYLIYDGERIKIGKTLYLSQRISSLSHTLKKDMTILHAENVIGYTLREKELHEIFSHKLISNEWFDLDDNDIEKAKSYLLKFKANTETNLVTY